MADQAKLGKFKGLNAGVNADGADSEMRRIGKFEEAQWDKRINQKVLEIIEDKVSIFKTSNKYDSTQSYRPFVNSINVKLKAGELNQAVKKKKKDEYLEQRFRITQTTNFPDLKSEACAFWGLDPHKYSLYDENLHDLMSLNQDPAHIAHTVEKYFEITRVKSTPKLYLKKPDQENALVLPGQKDAIRIRSEFFGGENLKKVEMQMKDPRVRKQEDDKEAVKRFIEYFPGMQAYVIGDRKSRRLNHSHLKSPDTRFCTLFVMLFFLMLTLLSVYLRRDLNLQYWLHEMVETQLTGF